jgi:hypothetical protein
MVRLLSAASGFFQEFETGQAYLNANTVNTATLTPLVQGDGSQIVIPNNVAIAFDILIGGRGIAGVNIGKVGYYQLSGIAKNISGVASVVIGVGGLVGGVIQLVQIEEVTAWQAIVTTSGTNLSFQVSGDTGTTVQWKATGQLLYI